MKNKNYLKSFKKLKIQTLESKNSIIKKMHHSLSILFLNLKKVQPKNHKNSWLIIFIAVNFFTALYSTLTFFFNYEINQNLDALKPAVTCDYEIYLHFSLIFAFISIFLCIFGCHCGEKKTTKGLLSYLVLTAMLFVFEFTFIAYLMKFKGNFIETVKNNYENYEKKEEWKLYDIRQKLNCDGNCKEDLIKFIEEKVNLMIFYIIGLMAWQVR